MYDPYAATMTPPTGTPSWLAFEPEPACASVARAHARALLDDADPGLVDDVVLVVGELVANAIVHAPADYIASAGVCPLIHMSLLVERRWVLVGVRDPWPGTPHRVRADTEWESGRGLAMVDQVAAARWTQTRANDKTVHALIVRPGCALRPGEINRLRA